ncbi:MAG TPA: acetyl-CoA carboxylase biotin carboxyl carrier protein subunit [Bacteroidales bacterium]|nr:acetyl-CoA carboxylase biotin carboxyl carrier protein subunit [Bacteroidales bacterium]
MEIDIRLDKRLAKVKLISRNKDHVVVHVDGFAYRLDVRMVEDHVYSVLHEGKSHNIEIIPGETNKKYFVNTIYKNYDLEIIDAETRYLQNRNKNDLNNEQNLISTPMPGKIVRINVKEGQAVAANDTLIVVSAMKMESEYKAGREAVIKKIMVKEGDTVKGHQPLIILE